MSRGKLRIVIRKTKEPLTILTLTITLAVLQLSQLITNRTTHLPTEPTAETTDYYHFHWNMWWIQHALSININPYITNYVLTPFTSNLSLHTLSAAWYPIWRIFEPQHGTSTAFTAIFTIAATLTGVTTYLVLRTHNVKPAFAAAGAILVQGSALTYESTKWSTLNLIGWFWLPILLLTWRQMANAAKHKQHPKASVWTGILAAVIWGMILTDLQYPLFAAFIIVPYATWILIKTKSTSTRVVLITYSLISIALALLLLWYAGPLAELLNFDRSVLATTPAERGPKVPFPEGFLWRLDRGISLGLIPLSLIAIAIILTIRGRAIRIRTNWFWLWVALPPLIFSAGASIEIANMTIPMPYRWLHELLGGIFRYPERFANVFLFPALIFSLAALSQTTSKRGWPAYAIHTILFLLVMADTRLMRPTPLQPIPPVYDIYEQMGRENYDYVVVEVPTAGASGEGIVGRSQWVATQWYGMTHGKRMVNGHISRVNPWHFLWMETADPMMAWLGQRRFLEPEIVARDMAERIVSWPIGYFVIHTQWLPQNSPTLQEVIGWFNAHRELVCPFAIERELIVYRTTWHPDGCPLRTPPQVEPGKYEIDIGEVGDERFIGWGWHWQEDIGATRWRWTGEYPEARLYVDLPAQNYRLRLAAQAFWETQTLDVSVNGQSLLQSEVIPDRLQEIEILIDEQLLGSGQQIEITLDYSTTYIPQEVGQSSDPRRLAVAIDWIRFETLAGH